jgi:RNA polymerase sigma-70 factor (ECF subfamily)
MLPAISSGLGPSKGRTTPSAPEPEAVVGRIEDPEVAHLRRQYGALLRTAVETQLARLPVDERNLLRFHFIDGLSLTQIATLRGVHQSTVSRLLARTRQDVLEGIRLGFRTMFADAEDEFSSVIRLVQSQLDVSIEQALGRQLPSLTEEDT